MTVKSAMHVSQTTTPLKVKTRKSKDNGSYDAIISEVFSDLIENQGSHDFLADGFDLRFTRNTLVEAAAKRGVEIPKNIGDVVYTFRYRRPLPEAIRALEPEGREWVIDGDGIGRYKARLLKCVHLTPDQTLKPINIPDDTSPINRRRAGTDEQFLLTRLRDSRVIAIFLGLTTWTRQNHLRTTVDGIGQIEIDEIYTAIDKHGNEYVVPVQAKGHADRHSTVQTRQDIAYCRQVYPNHRCVPVSAQFMPDGTAALFRLKPVEDDVEVEEELHYRLVTEWV